jgi:hypothetical protein
MWNLIDNRKKEKAGYLTITKNGQRVADVFPYATGKDSGGPEWTIDAAQEIVREMNKLQQSQQTTP